MIFGAGRMGFWFRKPTDFKISWSTSQNGILNTEPGGWDISFDNLRATFTVQNSYNCGGNNANIQTGVAVATIYTGEYNWNMSAFLDGTGERYAANYDRMNVYLSGHQFGVAPGTILSTGLSGGGGGPGSECDPGQPLVVTYYESPPYFLYKYKTYTLTLDYSTIDNLYHNGVYAQVDLEFFPIP